MADDIDSPDLVPIPGETFAVREELKQLGAVWSTADRIWSIAPAKLPLAIAIVENQALAPPPVSHSADLDTIADPFEEDTIGARQVALDTSNGDTYAARDALKVIGAQWDKGRRSWMIREDRAPYARAIIASVNGTERREPPATAAPVEDIPVADAPVAPLPKVTKAKPIPPSVPAPPPPVEKKLLEEKKAAVPVAIVPTTTAERIKLTGLWLNKTRDGQEYLTGKFAPSVRLLIFKNKAKQPGDNQPTHIMYLAPIEPSVETDNK